MPFRAKRLEETDRPFRQSIPSMVIDFFLWWWLFIMSGGMIWTLVLEQSWHNYRWLLAGIAGLTFFLILKRAWRRRRLKGQGLGHVLDREDLEDSRRRYPNLWRIFPSIESLVWVFLAVCAAVTSWTINTGQRVSIAGMIELGLWVFGIIIVGRLGWLLLTLGGGDD